MKTTECAVCGKKDGLQHHHFVPLGAGGKDINRNLLTLCQRHHEVMHDMARKKHRHGALVSAGIQRAKDSGVLLGPKPSPIEKFSESEGKRPPIDDVLVNLHARDRLPFYLIAELKWFHVIGGSVDIPGGGKIDLSSKTKKSIEHALKEGNITGDGLGNFISMVRLATKTRRTEAKMGEPAKASALKMRVGRWKNPREEIDWSIVLQR